MAEASSSSSESLLCQAGRAILDLLGRPCYLALLGPLLAYQRPMPIALNVGDSYARPYLRGFCDPEWGGGLDYALTSGSAALRLEGIGRGLALLELRMDGGVPSVEQLLSAGGIPLLRVPAPGGPGLYRVHDPADALALA